MICYWFSIPIRLTKKFSIMICIITDHIIVDLGDPFSIPKIEHVLIHKNLGLDRFLDNFYQFLLKCN